jgi:hypothetical protein
MRKRTKQEFDNKLRTSIDATKPDALILKHKSQVSSALLENNACMHKHVEARRNIHCESKKPCAQSFAPNFGNCKPIFKILSELKRRQKILTLNLVFVPLPV